MQREINADEIGEDKLPTVYMETDLENEVLDILKNLPEKYKDVFLLKYSADMENSEIAKVCGIKEVTVRGCRTGGAIYGLRRKLCCQMV